MYIDFKNNENENPLFFLMDLTLDDIKNIKLSINILYSLRKTEKIKNNKTYNLLKSLEGLNNQLNNIKNL